MTKNAQSDHYLDDIGIITQFDHPKFSWKKILKSRSEPLPEITTDTELIKDIEKLTLTAWLEKPHGDYDVPAACAC